MYILNWQPPYDWSWMLGFLAARAVSGVETVAGQLFMPVVWQWAKSRRGDCYSGYSPPYSAHKFK